METRTPGSEGGSGKRTTGNGDTAPRPDPYNKTGSVGLCMLLHGSFTAALDNLTLTSDSLTVDVTIAATLLAATLILVVATRGRLGYHPTTAGVSGSERG